MSISASSPDLARDPLNSPFPIPWQWILEVQQAVTAGEHPGQEIYRSPSLYNPHHQFAAYCRVRLDLRPMMYQSRVTSTLFVENLQTGILHTIMARSPLAAHPFQTEPVTADEPGVMALTMPISWSADGKTLLCRQLEGFFCSSCISDYGVVWQSETQQTITVAPSAIANYTHAVLLGWSESCSGSALFQAGSMGEENWHHWAVALDGTTVLATGDRGEVFGEVSSNIWSGSNAKFNH